MSALGVERSWRVYGSADQNSTQQEGISGGGAASESTNGETTMSAISFGFVATAILIAMFLIMAIFEHLFRPPPTTTSFSSPHESVDESLESPTVEKAQRSPTAPASYLSNFSVLMPGERYPTFIAQPVPLPCSRERVYWPPHDHEYSFALP